MQAESLFEEQTDVKPAGRLRRMSYGFYIGFVLAVVHFLFIALSIFDMLRKPGEPWHMFWVFLGYVDFPVSLLLPFVIIPIISIFISFVDPYLTGGLLMFITFSGFHLVAGSSWYFCLPILLERFSKKISGKVVDRMIVILLIIIPVFTNWLQLIKFSFGKTYPFTPLINSYLPAMWIILFIWLFFISSRRKRVLWLLCLMPFVFFNLVNDLYYCIKLGFW